MRAEFEAQLITRLKNAHRIESRVHSLIAHMTDDASEPRRIRQLESRGLQARHHKQRLQERLQSLGESPPGDGKPTHAHLQWGAPAPERPRESDGSLLIARLIASYELLESTATSAGDLETARIARLNRSEDQAFVGTVFADYFDLLGTAPSQLRAPAAPR